MQNVLRGAVILLQPDDFGLGEIALKFQDVADISAAPGIDALVFIAHHADVLLAARQQAHQFILRTVGVLILINQQILEAAVVALAHFAAGLQHARRFQQ